MSVVLPKNTQIALATAYATAIAFASLTNAAPPVAGSVAHGLADGDILLVNSGWTKLDGRIARVDNADTDDFELEGIDTTNTGFFPAAAGVGTVSKITAWTSITQVLDVQPTGGDQQFQNYEFFEDDMQMQVPDRIAAQSIALVIADDPTLPGYLALKAAHEASAIRALRFTLPNGSKIFYNGYVSFNETPSMSKGNVMSVRAQLSLSARATRYAT
ncbi:MAG: phage tail protein [Ramlibacter sp.]